MNNENTFKISRAENGFLLSCEELISKNDSISFDEYETTLYVFPDSEGVIKHLQENLK